LREDRMCEGLEFLSFVFSFIKQDDFLNCSPTMGTTCIFITQISFCVKIFEKINVFGEEVFDSQGICANDFWLHCV
jgi:hypothetical protein